MSPASVEGQYRFGLIGQDPAYLVQSPAYTSLEAVPLIAEVRLSKQGEDLTPAYVYDGEVTGEAVYTVVALKLVLDSLTQPPKPAKAKAKAPVTAEDSVPRHSAQPEPGTFTGDVHRGYGRPSGDSFMHGVTLKVRRVIHAAGLGPDGKSCPWTLFGNSQELFALETQPLTPTAPQLVKLRLRHQTFDPRQAEKIKSGLCLRPLQIAAEPLKPHLIYAMQSGEKGKLAKLELEVLQQLPFAAQAKTEPE